MARLYAKCVISFKPSWFWLSWVVLNGYDLVFVNSLKGIDKQNCYKTDQVVPCSHKFGRQVIFAISYILQQLRYKSLYSSFFSVQQWTEQKYTSNGWMKKSGTWCSGIISGPASKAGRAYICCKAGDIPHRLPGTADLLWHEDRFQARCCSNQNVCRWDMQIQAWSSLINLKRFQTNNKCTIC